MHLITCLCTGQLGCTPIPDDSDEEALQEPVVSVLIFLFTSLPASSAQDLFRVLHRAYPQPIDCSESQKLYKLSHNRKSYEPYVVVLPTLKSIIPQLSHHDADAQQDNESVSASTAVDSIQRRARHLLSVVSPSHVTFLEELYVCSLSNAGNAEPLLILQLGLLYFQARNCRLSDGWYNDTLICQSSDPTRMITKALLHKGNHSAAVRHLIDTWKYCLTPQQTCKALAKAATNHMPVCNDVCSLVQSIADSFPIVSRLALEVLFYGPPEKFLDQMVSAIQSGELFLNKKDPLAEITAVHMDNPCRLLELVGRMHTKIKTNPTQVTNADECLRHLQDFSRTIVLVMTSQTKLYTESLSQMRPDVHCFATSRSLFTLNVHDIAGVICDAGQDVVVELLSFLPLLPSFPNDLKMLYARVYGVAATSVSGDLLLVPPFQTAILQALENRKNDVQRVIDESNIKSSFRLKGMLRHAVENLRNLSAEFGYEADCSAFMAEVALQLTPSLKQVIDRERMKSHK